MAELSSGTPPSGSPPEDRLDSWKEIAAYLRRDVTTVQRWEKREGMPVHRHLHDRMGSVYASRQELDGWALSRNLRPAEEKGGEVSTPDTTAPPPTVVRRSVNRWRLVWTLTAVVITAAMGASLWLWRTEHF